MAEAQKKKADLVMTQGATQSNHARQTAAFSAKLGMDCPQRTPCEAIYMFAQPESILLDPVYSGKGAAGLTDLIRKGHFKKGESVVFLHTGGSATLFGYTANFHFSEKYST